MPLLLRKIKAVVREASRRQQDAMIDSTNMILQEFKEVVTDKLPSCPLDQAKLRVGDKSVLACTIKPKAQFLSICIILISGWFHIVLLPVHRAHAHPVHTCMPGPRTCPPTAHVPGLPRPSFAHTCAFQTCAQPQKR